MTTGEATSDKEAFRPTYSNLFDRVRVHLSPSACVAAFSATFPPTVAKKVKASLQMHDDRTIEVLLSTNRPNLVYATLPIVGSINQPSNLNFLVPVPYHPPMAPLIKGIIFVDNKLLARSTAAYLNALLPPTLAALKPFRHYHSSMSDIYCQQTFDLFQDPQGIVDFLVATSCASNVRSFDFHSCFVESSSCYLTGHRSLDLPTSVSTWHSGAPYGEDPTRGTRWT